MTRATPAHFRRTLLATTIASCTAVALPAAAQVLCNKSLPYSAVHAAQLPNQTWIVKGWDGSVRKFRGPPEDADVLLPTPPACPFGEHSLRCPPIFGEPFSTFAVLGNRVFFAGGTGAGNLYESDGTIEGTREFGAGLGPPLQAPGKQLVHDGLLYFSAYQDGRPDEPGFRTDGTWDGTQPSATLPFELAPILGADDQGLYWAFPNDDLVYSRFSGGAARVWSIDTDTLGRNTAQLARGLVFRWNTTLMLAHQADPVRPLSTPDRPYGWIETSELVTHGGRAYAVASSADRVDLVRTDGTDAGTLSVHTWPHYSFVIEFSNFGVALPVWNDRIILGMDSHEFGTHLEIWAYDLITGEATRLVDLQALGINGYATPMVVGPRLVFFAPDGFLWTTNGTQAGTRRLCTAFAPALEPWERPIICNSRVFLQNQMLNICPADYNNDLAIDIQDIFDFLEAYFQNRPSADINGRDGATVQDIFDYLPEYFRGCP